MEAVVGWDEVGSRGRVEEAEWTEAVVDADEYERVGCG